MGTFDDALRNAVPGGNLATPIAVAAGALILGKIFGGSSASGRAGAVDRAGAVGRALPAASSAASAT